MSRQDIGGIVNVRALAYNNAMVPYFLQLAS